MQARLSRAGLKHAAMGLLSERTRHSWACWLLIFTALSMSIAFVVHIELTPIFLNLIFVLMIVGLWTEGNKHDRYALILMEQAYRCSRKPLDPGIIA